MSLHPNLSQQVYYHYYLDDAIAANYSYYSPLYIQQAPIGALAGVPMIPTQSQSRTSIDFDYQKILSMPDSLVLEFILSKSESITLQKYLVSTKPCPFKTEVMSRLIRHISYMSSHPVGNYVAQALVQSSHSIPDAFNLLLQVISADIPSLCLSHYGTRVVQTIIHSLPSSSMLYESPGLSYLIDRKTLKYLAVDGSGCFIVCKLFEMDSPVIIDILEAFLDDSNEVDGARNYSLAFICCHQSGVMTVKKLIDRLHGSFIEEKTIKLVFSKFSENFRLLARDRYGNYFIQHLLSQLSSFSLKWKSYSENLIDLMLMEISTDLIGFCNNSFSSHCVEKLLDITEKMCVSLAMDPSDTLQRTLFSREENIGLVSLLLDKSCSFFVLQRILLLLSNSQSTIKEKVFVIVRNSIEKILFAKRQNRKHKRLHHENIVPVFGHEDEVSIVCLIKKLLRVFPELKNQQDHDTTTTTTSNNKKSRVSHYHHLLEEEEDFLILKQQQSSLSLSSFSTYSPHPSSPSSSELTPVSCIINHVILPSSDQR